MYGGDCVPFLSIDAGRRLLAGLRAVDEYAGTQSMNHTSRIIFGQQPAEAALAARVEETGAALRAIELAPRLCIPAARVLWLTRAHGSCTCDAVACAPEELAAVGIGLTRTMMSDHMVDKYEGALSECI